MPVVRPCMNKAAKHKQASHVAPTRNQAVQNSKGRWQMNSAGVRPPHLPPPPDGCTTWVGDPALPPQNRGLRVLGSPLGTDECIAAQLQHLSVQHRAPLQLLPGIHDLQLSWLLLLFCASPRVHYCLRLLPPPLTAVFAAQHDNDRNILCCLAQPHCPR